MPTRGTLRPVVLLVGAPLLLGQAGCDRDNAAQVAETAPAAPAWSLDESRLPAPIRFSAADLDPTRNACTDLAEFANDKWLAANPIPGDQTSWGAVEHA